MRTYKEKYEEMEAILDRFFSKNASESNLNDYVLCYSTLGILHDITNGIYPTDEVIEE